MAKLLHKIHLLDVYKHSKFKHHLNLSFKYFIYLLMLFNLIQLVNSQDREGKLIGLVFV